MLKLLRRAHDWRRQLDTGPPKTISDVAASNGVNASYFTQVLRIAYLAPDIVPAIMEGRQPPALTAESGRRDSGPFRAELPPGSPHVVRQELLEACASPGKKKAFASLWTETQRMPDCLAVHAFITLPVMLRFIGKVRPFKTMSGASPAMLTAFSTATLPVTMDCVEDNLGVSNKISSFVLPLGATVNMNGTALYECAAAVFLAQAYGLELSLGVQFSIVITALLTSIGVAGVPSASLGAIAIILAAVGLPVEAIGVLMVFDRILDIFRTSINVWGDACCATIVARLQGEQTNVSIDGTLEEEPA